MLDHERLMVYRAALRFVGWLNPVFDALPRALAVVEQLDRASTSMVLKIAEGNGKFMVRDRARFLDIARGSALECAACLDVLALKGRMDGNRAEVGKRSVEEIVAMLVGLVKRVDPERFGGRRGGGRREEEQEQEQENE